MYGERQYWEDRYEDGVVGHCQQKGVVSNEWYLQYPALQTILHQHTSKHYQTVVLAQDSSIDTLIDKATLDCLMNCDDWQGQVQRMLGQAARVLKPNGKFICISHSKPEDRIHILTGRAYSWKLVEHVEVQKNTATFYVYIMQKHLARRGRQCGESIPWGSHSKDTAS
ncbi:TPA: hypothetical protein ACH3X3_001035 [Trebouxia sp. C0006]